MPPRPVTIIEVGLPSVSFQFMSAPALIDTASLITSAASPPIISVEAGVAKPPETLTGAPPLHGTLLLLPD